MKVAILTYEGTDYRAMVPDSFRRRRAILRSRYMDWRDNVVEVRASKGHEDEGLPTVYYIGMYGGRSLFVQDW